MSKNVPVVFLSCGSGSDISVATLNALIVKEPSAHICSFSRYPLSDKVSSKVRSKVSHFVTTYGLSDLTATLSSLVLEPRYRLWILVGNGQLMPNEQSPEKAFSQLDEQQLAKLWEINTSVPLRFLKSAETLFADAVEIRIFVLSAQIGSIADNQFGGWYSYRMTKAALNMAVKTLAIEWCRKYRCLTLHPLHPGTTETKFTKKYLSSRDPGSYCSASETGKRIIDRFLDINEQNLSGFYHANGHLIPW